MIPSRQVNLPNTGLEDPFSGITVCAFATCGLCAIADHHGTGALAEPFDPLSLVTAIRWVLVDPQCYQQIGQAARGRLWNLALVMVACAGVYGEAI